MIFYFLRMDMKWLDRLKYSVICMCFFRVTKFTKSFEKEAWLKDIAQVIYLYISISSFL